MIQTCRHLLWWLYCLNKIAAMGWTSRHQPLATSKATISFFDPVQKLGRQLFRPAGGCGKWETGSPLTDNLFMMHCIMADTLYKILKIVWNLGMHYIDRPMVTMKHYWEVDIGLSESAKKLTSDDLDGVISRSRKWKWPVSSNQLLLCPGCM